MKEAAKLRIAFMVCITVVILSSFSLASVLALPVHGVANTREHGRIAASGAWNNMSEGLAKAGRAGSPDPTQLFNAPGESLAFNQSVRAAQLFGSAKIFEVTYDGGEWVNGSSAAEVLPSVQLAGVIRSPAGDYYATYSASIVQSSSNASKYFVEIQDALWNESKPCVSPTVSADNVVSVQGDGGLVSVGTGCQAVYYLSTLVLGLLTLPAEFNLSLQIFAAESGAFGLEASYSVSVFSQHRVFEGVSDTAVLDPGHIPVQAVFGADGETPIGQPFDAQISLVAATPHQVVNLTSVNSTFTLMFMQTGGHVLMRPSTAYDYGLNTLSFSLGATSRIGLIRGRFLPEANVTTGTQVNSRLWPVYVKARAAVTQFPPGSQINVAAQLGFFDAYIQNYVALNVSSVTVYLNSSLAGGFNAADGSLKFSFQPTSEGVYNLSLGDCLWYTGCFAAEVPIPVASLQLKTVGNMSLPALTMRAGSPSNQSSFALSSNETVYLYVASGGVVLEAPVVVQASAGVGLGPYGYYATLNRSLVDKGSNTIVLKPVRLTLVYGRVYLVSFVNKFVADGNQTLWVTPGATVNVSAPEYVYEGAGSERLVFDEWSNGLPANVSFTVTGPETANATYRTEYHVVIVIPNQTLVSGYYYAGQKLVAAAPEYHGGSFWYPKIFSGWFGYPGATSRIFSLTVNSSVFAQAVYLTTDVRINAVEVFVALGLGIDVAIILQKRKV